MKITTKKQFEAIIKVGMYVETEEMRFEYTEECFVKYGCVYGPFEAYTGMTGAG